MIKSSAFIFLFALSVVNCQFYYNYEEDRLDEPQTEEQNYDPSAYQYNPPSAVNQQFVQPRRNDAESVSEAGRRRTRIRVRSRNYQSEPDYNEPQPQPEHAPVVQPETDHRAARVERRQARRRQRQNDYVEPVLPPRVYSPSVFENIGLGEAPSGVYIPQDSFLNVLRNPSRRAEPPVSQPVAAVPQTTNYIQPSVSYVNSGPQPRFFVQPPTNEEPRQSNVILPVTRSQTQYVNPPPAQPTNLNHNSASVQARAVGTNRRSHQRIRPQPEYAAPPTVDIDSFREYTDDVDRENVMSQVQYVPVNNRQNTRTQNRRRTVRRYQESTPAPRVYSPSAFEKVPLGEAPTGVYIPEDSLLNVLRNPSSVQHSTHRVSRREPPQLSPQQPRYADPNDYEAEIIDEEQYQPPPPPPPPPTRRRSSQRSRQTQPSRPSQRQGYQNDYEEKPAVQTIQPSTQRRSERRNEDFEDFERQRPPAQHRTQTHRRPAPAPAPSAVSAPRPRPQASTSESGQSTFRKAKLAIAELPLDTDDDGIPGEAGVNYPTLHEIPKTTFSCSQQSHNGYYADLETSCQVVHLCQSGGVQDSFLCPNGTIFSQEKFSCQWWYKVNCSEAPKFYVKNDELYKVPEKKERKRN